MAKYVLTNIAHHRNGICGDPFWVVLFRYKDGDDEHRLVGIVFSAANRVAVLDADQTAAGHIAFGQGNSWRGDEFEDWLRAQVAAQRDAGGARHSNEGV